MSEYWQNDDRSWSDDSLHYILTPQKIDKDLFYYIQEVGSFKASKPYFTERENMPSFLMKYTYSGQGTLFYQGKNYFLEQGDIFFIDCMEYQYYYTSSEDPWEMDWIHFNGANSKQFYEYFSKDSNITFKTNNSRIPSIMTKILNLQLEKNSRTDFNVSLLIHDLLNELIIQKNHFDFQDADIPDYLSNMKNYLDSSFRKNITLDDLEKKYNINKYQLIKEFSKYIGVPPIEYLIMLKISYAQEQLRYSTKPIQAISLEIGINNFSYFSRLFKKKVGISPSNYRNSTSFHNGNSL